MQENGISRILNGKQFFVVLCLCVKLNQENYDLKTPKTGND